MIEQAHQSYKPHPTPEVEDGQLYGISLAGGTTVSLVQEEQELYLRVKEPDGTRHQWHFNGYEDFCDAHELAKFTSGEREVTVTGSMGYVRLTLRKPGFSGKLEHAFFNEPVFKLSFEFNSSIRPANGQNSFSVSMGTDESSAFVTEINTRQAEAAGNAST